MGVDADLNIDDDKKQLFVVSVGNIRDTLVHGQYPNRNDVEAVENPSQSWNALSVGATTLKSFSEDKTLDGWELVAVYVDGYAVHRSNKGEELLSSSRYVKYTFKRPPANA